MSADRETPAELGEAELAEQHGELLPDRRAMSLLNPGLRIVPLPEPVDPNPSLPVEPPEAS